MNQLYLVLGRVAAINTQPLISGSLQPSAGGWPAGWEEVNIQQIGKYFKVSVISIRRNIGSC